MADIKPTTAASVKASDDKPAAAKAADDKAAAAATAADDKADAAVDVQASADRAAKARDVAVADFEQTAADLQDQAVAAREDRESRAEESREAALDARAAYDSPPDAKGPQYVPAAGSDPDSQNRLGKAAEAAGVVVDWDATYARAADARADGAARDDRDARTTAAERRAAAARDDRDQDDVDKARSTPPKGRTSLPGQSTVTGPGGA